MGDAGPKTQGQARSAGLRTALAHSALRSQSDERLVRLARDGAEQAFDEIVRRYRAPLSSYCSRWLDRASAEDAVQDTFVAAARQIREDERPLDLRPWLYTVAHNCAIDIVKNVVPRYDPIDDDCDGSPQPSQIVEQKSFFSELKTAIKGLPTAQRSALLRHEFEGENVAAIAKELETSDNYVQQLLARARKRLRQTLGLLIPLPLLRRMLLPGTRLGRGAALAALPKLTALLVAMGFVVAAMQLGGVFAPEGSFSQTSASAGARDSGDQTVPAEKVKRAKTKLPAHELTARTSPSTSVPQKYGPSGQTETGAAPKRPAPKGKGEAPVGTQDPRPGSGGAAGGVASPGGSGSGGAGGGPGGGVGNPPVTPGWQEPVTISAASAVQFAGLVSIDPMGNALVVWQSFDGANLRIEAAARPAGGSFAAPQLLSGPGANATLPQVAVDAQGNAVAIWLRHDGANWRIESAERPAGGSFAAPQLLSGPGANATAPQIAFDPQGNALAVWQRYDGANWRIESAERPAGGGFAAPELLSSPGLRASSPQIAFDPQGNALAVWQRYDGVDWRIESAARPAGGSFAAPQLLSGQGANATGPQIAFDAQGNAVAVWESFNGAVLRIASATRPAGGSFAAPELLSDAVTSSYEPEVAFGPEGDAIAVWNRVDEAGYNRIEAATRSAGSSFGTPELLSDAEANAFNARAAVDSKGNAMVLWDRYEGSSTQIEASARQAGHGFEPPQLVSRAGVTARYPQIAFDSDDNALVTWRASDGASFWLEATTFVSGL